MKNKIIRCCLLLFSLVILISGCGDKKNDLSPGEIEENTSQTDYSQVYSIILDDYYNLIVNGSQEDETIQGKLGILEVLSNQNTGEALNSIGYTLLDISKDGIPELLIGAISENRNSSFYGNIIFAAYTSVDESPQLTFEGSARSSYRYIGEQDFLYQGSNGAMYSIFATYTLSPDGTKLACNDYYFTHEKEDHFDDIGFYHNTSGEWNPSASEELSLSDDQFWQIESDLMERIQNLELTPFSKYKPINTVIDDDVPTPIRAHRAEDVLYNFSDYDEFFADSNDFRESVVFVADHDVHDFKVLAITLENVEDDGTMTFSTEELYNLDILTPEHPLLVHMTFYGTIPHYGISYTDNNGIVHNFAVTQSGMDGSLLLNQFKNQ